MTFYERLVEFLHYDPYSGVFTWNYVTPSSRARARHNTMFAGKNAGCIKKGYLEIRFEGRNYRAGRLAWLIAYKAWPIGIVDHHAALSSYSVARQSGVAKW